MARERLTRRLGRRARRMMRVWLESDRRFVRLVHAMLPQDFGHLTRYRVLKPIHELEHTRLHDQRQEIDHDPRSQGEAAPRPGAPRFRESRAHLQARGRHHLPAHRRGLALPGHRHRPVHPHGGRLVTLEPHDRRHHGGGARVGQFARLRGGKRHIPQQ